MDIPCLDTHFIEIAWWKYWSGDYVAMSQALAASANNCSSLPAAVVTAWIGHFTQMAAAQGVSLDIQMLTDLPEWQQLLASVLKLESDRRPQNIALSEKTTTNFALYRILGNDLPPRHYRGQTADNLRFILNYEPPLQNCQKRWIVNKIVDSAQERAVLKLLSETHQRYTYLPFDQAAYAEVPFDLESFLEPDFLRSTAFQQLDANSAMWATDRPYYYKRRQLVSLNQVRNRALAEGKQLAEWTLVLDGSCFVTGEAWAQIVQAGTERADSDQRPCYKHLIIPMVRLLHNEQLFLPASIPPPEEEPHIAIHRASKETYDETLHYGRFNKVEFLRRIQVPGVWDSWNYKPWERKQWQVSAEAHQWKKAGWVVRLSSGHALDCDQTIEGMTARTWARQEAVWDFIDGLDESIFRHRFHAQQLLFWHRDTLDGFRQGWQENAPRAVAVVKSLIREIEPCREVMAQVSELAITAYLTNQAEYVTRAIALLREHFLAVSPNKHPMAYWQGMHYFLDALRLLERLAEDWPSIDYQSVHWSIRDWCQGALNWRLQSPQGQADNFSDRCQATFYDLQVAALAGYCDDARTLLKTLEYSKMRIDRQFDAEGHQRHEAGGRESLEGCVVTLMTWAALMRMGDRLGIDIAHYTTQNGRGLEQAFKWLLSRCADSGVVESVSAERWQLLRRVAFEYYPSLEATFGARGLSSFNEGPSVYFPEGARSSFWIFALSPDKG